MTIEMPLLERAARALQEEANKFEAPVYCYVEQEAARRWEAANPGSFWGDDPAHYELDIGLESWKILARAVLQAIREPSEAMALAALDLGPDRDPETYYVAMIDAALGDQLKDKTE